MDPLKAGLVAIIVSYLLLEPDCQLLTKYHHLYVVK